MEIQDGSFGLQASGTAQLDTVRALHQTVVSLRAALEASKAELSSLREKYQTHNCSVFEETIEKLSLENHILRRRIISNENLDVEITSVANTGPKNQKSIKFEIPQSERSDTICSVHIESFRESTDEQHLDLPDFEVVIKADSIASTQEDSCHDLILDENKELFELEHSSDCEEVIISVNDDEIVISEVLTDDLLIEPTIPEENVKSAEIEENVLEETSQKEASLTPKYVEFSDAENIVISEPNQKHHSQKKQKPTEFQTKIELQSKFDVTISVSASKHTESNFSSSGSSESTSGSSNKTADVNLKNDSDSPPSEIETHSVHVNQHQESVKVSSRTKEKIAMAVPTDSEQSNAPCDRFNVQVRITSEENLVVDHNLDKGKTSDNLNLDVDDLSLRSLSEGDNSVFSEDLLTPIEGHKEADRQREVHRDIASEQDNISGNESEEVDDIELIFTTDETKDVSNFQEDLVSITEGDSAWRSGQSETSTPILLKFNPLDPDTQADQGDRYTTVKDTETGQRLNENEDQRDGHSTLGMKGQKKKPHLKSILGKSSSTEHRHQQRSMESTDSLSFDNHRTLSFENTNKSSSFERNSSLDLVSREISFDQRDESVDQFDPPHADRMTRPRFSIFVETDISKCGIIEDEVSSCNLHSRRNTCPNPFQYRPIPHREALRSRSNIRGVSTGGTRARPILTADNLSMRRENTAQTDVSALPNRWSSDGYLAHRVGVVNALTTLPSKYNATAPKQGSQRPKPVLGHSTSLRTSYLAAPANVHHHRSDETRRVMLSDIGFTSMVPELSRSADPLWACDAHRTAPVRQSSQGLSVHPAPGTCHTCGGAALIRRSSSSVGGSRQWSVPTSPTRYLSKGSMNRSQSGSLTTSAYRKSSLSSGLTSKKKYGDKVPSWRGSLPELRGDSGDSTDELMDEVDAYLRRSVDNINPEVEGTDDYSSQCGAPYLPAEPRQLKLGHLVKIITPHGRIAVGKVRYVGLAGGPTSTLSGVPGSPTTYIGIQLGPTASQGIPFNDGTLHGRRYFRCDQGCIAIFVPFNKVVMAWSN